MTGGVPLFSCPPVIIRLLFFLSSEHQPDDFFIGLLHAAAGQLSDGFNGVFDAFFDDAVAAEELVAVFIHGQAQQAGVHGYRFMIVRFSAVGTKPGVICVRHSMSSSKEYGWKPYGTPHFTQTF